jgi:anthranilate phosphoribosyltransferase
MLKESINTLVNQIDLTEDEMVACMNEIMEGAATDAQIGAFLTALRMKGESVAEITGAARVMREKATRIAAPEGVIDTCGTGGDMSGTFNISTTTALVVAACGVPVAKHGNRSVSSKSGSADVLEALGVKIDLEPAKVEACLAETGFGFLFAPLFHPAMKFAIGPRREMGIRTVFNILGPITNPAGAKHQVLGVFSSRLTDTLCQVLGNLGATDVMVVHGEDGLDEITITDGTKVSRLVDGAVENSILSPEDYGIKRAELSAIAGSGKDENARITLEIFEGVLGPRRDVVLMNAAAALAVAGKAPAMSDGFAIAAEALDSGAARAKLRQVVDVSNRL